MPLSLRAKLIYGIGAIPPAARQALFGLYTLYLYTTVMGLPASLVGIATAIGLAWEALVGTYVGHLSDRIGGGFRRRHAFMLAGGIGLGISFWAFFAPPVGLSTEGLFLWLLVSSLLVRTMTSIFAVPYLALGVELANDYHERTSISWARGFVGGLGAAALASLSFILFFPSHDAVGDPKMNYDGYVAMGAIFGLLMTGFALAATLGTSHQHRPSTLKSEGASNQNLWRASLGVLRNRSFLILGSACTLIMIGVIFNRILALHFLTFQAVIVDSTALTLVKFVGFLGTVAGLIISAPLVRRVEKLTMIVVSTIGTGVAMICAFLFFGEGRLFGTGNLPAMFAFSMVAGALGSVALFLPQAMLADIVDQDELTNRARREGLLFGVFGMLMKVATGIALLAGGVLAEFYAGLVPGAAEQSSTTAERIGVLFGLLPGLLMIVAGVVATRYPLNVTKVRAIQEQLKERRGVDGEDPAAEYSPQVATESPRSGS